MSTLFVDAMRAAVYANATGFYESSEQTERRLRYEAEMAKFCRDELDLDDDALYCGLAKRHRGAFHIAVIGDQEVRWRKVPHA